MTQATTAPPSPDSGVDRADSATNPLPSKATGRRIWRPAREVGRRKPSVTSGPQAHPLLDRARIGVMTHNLVIPSPG